METAPPGAMRVTPRIKSWSVERGSKSSILGVSCQWLVLVEVDEQGTSVVDRRFA